MLSPRRRLATISRRAHGVPYYRWLHATKEGVLFPDVTPVGIMDLGGMRQIGEVSCGREGDSAG